MHMIDPEQERRRLEGVYAAQSDEQLEEVAKQTFELTDVAREVLRGELTKRGLYVGQLDEAPAVDVQEFRDLVTIRSFWTLAEADLAKGLLASAGIDSFLFDDNLGREFTSIAVDGVKLRVDAENAEDAVRILDEKVAADLSDPESEDSKA